MPGPPGGDWNETVIPVGGGAEGFDVSPDGKLAWVANAWDGTISVIDLAQKKVTSTVQANARGANRLKFTPDGMRVLVSAGPELIEFVVDKNVHKHGKYMPGLHNPIFDVTAIAEKKPDYLVLLVWNLKDEILKQQDAFRKAGGKFIVPVPTPEIV